MCLRVFEDSGQSAEPTGVERRRDPRVTANPHPIVLVWTQHGWMRRALGTVLDVSRGGALLQVDRMPPVGEATWMHLKATGPSDWIPLTVLEGHWRTERTIELRVAFAEGCPEALFQSLAWGPVLLEPTPGIDTYA